MHLIIIAELTMSFVSVTPYQLSGRYAERNKWENLKGAGDSRPTGEQIIEDENLKGAWKGKVVLITGVSKSAFHCIKV